MLDDSKSVDASEVDVPQQGNDKFTFTSGATYGVWWLLLFVLIIIIVLIVSCYIYYCLQCHCYYV